MLVLPGYRIEPHPASAVLGEVYRAMDLKQNVPCAIKRYRLREIADPEATRLRLNSPDETNLHHQLDQWDAPNSVSFEQAQNLYRHEVRILNRLNRSDRPGCIPQLHAHFVISGEGFLVMTLYEGEDFEQRLLKRPQPLSWTEVCIYLPSLIEAIHFLHQHHVLHLDIKPSNIMALPKSKTGLIDFGVAHIIGDNASNNSKLLDGISSGFSPPEQYRGRMYTGPTSDIYALAATLVNLLTGEKPINARERTDDEHLINHKQRLDTLPAKLLLVLKKGLALIPDQRYQSIEEFGKALMRLC